MRPPARVPVERSSPHPRYPREVMTRAELAEATAALISFLKGLVA